MQTVRVCLVMIVKNESKIIERCIQSALPVLDAICICDTGSTDDTKELIQQVAEKYSLPCKVVDDPFVDFGTNRTHSFQNAKRFITEELQWNPKTSFALLSDADMCLKIGLTAQELIQGKEQDLTLFHRKLLVEQGTGNITHFLLDQVNGSLVYSNVRLLRFDTYFKCIGKTHEYWSGSGEREKLDLLCYDDHDDGGAKHDKFERDVRLLRSTLEEKPNDPRTLFYLGMSLKNSGNHLEAIPLLEKRSQLTDFEEEAWYALLEIGRSYISLEKEPEMLQLFLRAFEKRPHRPEPLWELAKFYRVKGKNHMAYMFAKRALDYCNKDAQGDILFVDYTLLEYKLDYELSITGYYVGNIEKQQAIVSADKLLHCKKSFSEFKSSTESNILFYLSKVATDSSIRLHSPSQWKALNPSIVPLNDTQSLCCVRTVNYTHDTKAGTYHIPDGSGIIKTQNYLCTLEHQVLLDGQTTDLFAEMIPIQDQVQGEMKDTQVQGMEDVRLCWRKNTLAFTCATRITANAPQQVLCVTDFHRDSPSSQKVVQVLTKYVLEPHVETSCEKNWVFLDCNTDDNTISFIYHHDQGGHSIVLDYDLETYALIDQENTNLRLVKPKEIHKETSPYLRVNCCESYRGSGAPQAIPETLVKQLGEKLEGEYSEYSQNIYSMGVIHFVIFKPHRIYLHRLVLYSKQGAVLYSSLPFEFQAETVEYAAGCVWVKEKFLISYGFQDAQAKLCALDWKKISELFTRK